jgi:glycosyltransferase involved in cell wall biosynthesis
MNVVAARTVSAVLPTHNRRGPLADAVASALSQTWPLHELIVVDDGSSDGSWEYLQQLAGQVGAPRIVIHRQVRAGPSAARNAGIRLASGRFIAFLDSDDLWHPEKTARQLDVFDEQPDLALLGCVAQGMNVFSGRRVVAIGVNQLLYRNYLLTPGVLARREVLIAAGGFAEDMTRCEDYELWLRIAAGHRCALLNEVLVTCGGGKRPFGESGLSADLWAMQRGELEALRRWHAGGGGLPRYLGAWFLCWLRFGRRLAIAARDRLRRRAGARA